MNSLRAFIREKGLYLVCLALIFAATITSIWAIRNVVRGVGRLTDSQAAQQPENGGENAWNAPDAAVGKPVTDLPQSSSAPSAQPSALPSQSAAPSPSAAGQEGSGAGAGSSARQPDFSGLPVAGEAAQGFSGDELVYSGTLGDWRTHNGLDYACAEGEPVRACRGGKVSAAEADSLWGGVVEVTDAEGIAWRYCGLAQPALRVGDTLNAGDRVGTVAAVPCEAGAGTHLHLKCRQGTGWLDPAALLKNGG